VHTTTTGLLVEVGVLLTFCPAGLKLSFPNLCLLSSWDYKHQPQYQVSLEGFEQKHDILVAIEITHCGREVEDQRT
jgi:hypothetical protein